MASEENRAAAIIRDHVVPHVQAKGHPQPVGPTTETMWDVGAFRIVLRTPESPRTLRPNAPAYAEAQAATEAEQTLPNGLEVWHNEKVFSIEWDAAELTVLRFERGPWEQQVMKVG